jgi:hypothetical protein
MLRILLPNGISIESDSDLHIHKSYDEILDYTLLATYKLEFLDHTGDTSIASYKDIPERDACLILYGLLGTKEDPVNYISLARNKSGSPVGYLVGDIPGLKQDSKLTSAIQNRLKQLDPQGQYRNPVSFFERKRFNTLQTALKRSAVTGKYAYMYLFRTEESVRGKGFGKLLMDGFFKIIKDSPAFLRTTKNANYQFYEHFGWLRLVEQEGKTTQLYAYGYSKNTKVYAQMQKAAIQAEATDNNPIFTAFNIIKDWGYPSSADNSDYHTKTWKQFEKDKEGICFDYVNYLYYKFSQHNPKCYYTQMVTKKSPHVITCTHTFIVFPNNTYVETAAKNFIQYKRYTTLKEIFLQVQNMLFKDKRAKESMFGGFYPYTPHNKIMTIPEFLTDINETTDEILI